MKKSITDSILHINKCISICQKLDFYQKWHEFHFLYHWLNHTCIFSQMSFRENWGPTRVWLIRPAAISKSHTWWFFFHFSGIWCQTQCLRHSQLIVFHHDFHESRKIFVFRNQPILFDHNPKERLTAILCSINIGFFNSIDRIAYHQNFAFFWPEIIFFLVQVPNLIFCHTTIQYS